jgi:L-galactose dehydrogenase
MEFRVLGRTGLSASVMGLGCGGPSRLGKNTGKTEEESIRVVRTALDIGINFLDTAEAYTTETIVGKAIADVPRDSVILSTKIGTGRPDDFTTSESLTTRLDACLERLQTDYVDILHLHGVSPEGYSRALDLVPTMMRLQEVGKIRFLGITEAFGPDPSHKMLRQAITDDCWDVMMVGYNLLNHSARETVFPTTIAKNIGTLCMFAVRRALSQPEKLQATLQEMIDKGVIRAGDFDMTDPLGFLTADNIAPAIPDAAYRFCRDEPGMHVILSGTGNPDHLKENAASLERPPLPPEITANLYRLFAGVDSVSGN